MVLDTKIKWAGAIFATLCLIALIAIVEGNRAEREREQFSSELVCGVLEQGAPLDAVIVGFSLELDGDNAVDEVTAKVANAVILDCPEFKPDLVEYLWIGESS